MKSIDICKSLFVKSLIIFISIFTANCSKEEIIGDIIVTKFYEEGLTAAYLEDFIEVDLNSDRINDIGIGYKSADFCDYFGGEYFWGVKSLNGGSSCKVNLGSWVPHCFELGEEINKENNWSDSWVIFELLDPCSDTFLETFEKDTAFYMGFRIQINSAYHYAWLHIETVDDDIILNSYGYNNTPDHPITAGCIK